MNFKNTFKINIINKTHKKNLNYYFKYLSYSEMKYFNPKYNSSSSKIFLNILNNTNGLKNSI